MHQPFTENTSTAPTPAPARQVFIGVTSYTTPTGRVIPATIHWENGQQWMIDRVLNVRPAHTTTLTIPYLDGSRRRTLQLFEIPGLKAATDPPLLTTPRSCINFIDSALDDPRLKGCPPGAPLRIRSARLRRGLSQMMLGMLLGYPDQEAKAVVEAWESGKKTVPWRQTKSLARFLGLTLLDLL